MPQPQSQPKAQPNLGLGIAWRPQIALMIERRKDLGFAEIVAENIELDRGLPKPIEQLMSRGVRVVPHGISLSLGGAEPVDRARVKRLADLAKAVHAPLVSEHIAFVRAGGVEAGHLLPIPRTQASLNVLVENVKIAQDLLPVPLALENISTLFEWPDAQMEEADFVRQALDRTGARLLLDLSNVHANAQNLGRDPTLLLDSLPLDRLAYVHVGGGVERDGVYFDTHAHPTPPEALVLLTALASRSDIPGYMLERDEAFPSDEELNRELDGIVSAVERGRTAATHHG